MKKDNKKNKDKKDKIKKESRLDKERKLEEKRFENKKKKFVIGFLIWICILGVSMVRKSLQNDTFYTIEIGELILKNGIDMLDHFSFHTDLAYTYPHWLYDVFIYLCYSIGGYVGIHISSVVLLLLLLLIVFKINKEISNSCSVAAFGTLICALAISGFATARAQLVSFLIFALEIYFIEKFLKNKNKKYLIGLLLLSIIICNVHLAVWPFYFVIYLSH